MSVYREVAAQARGAYERQRRLDPIAVEVDAQAKKAICALESEVVPRLMQAICDIRLEHVEGEITRFYDVWGRKVFTRPAVRFRCRGPRRRSDSWQFDAPGVLFDSDGRDFRLSSVDLGFCRDENHQLVCAVGRDPEQMVCEGLKVALDAYFTSLAEHSHDF